MKLRHRNQYSKTRRTLAVSLVSGSLLLATGSFVLNELASDVNAQTTGATLAGLVTDPSGAAVPGAHLTLQNTGTGAKHQLDSNGSGEYTLTALPPGDYSLNVARPGFRSYQQQGIVLTVSEQATANVVLLVGATENTITVTANASVINTTSAEISNIVNQRAISQLPLNGRDPSSLVLLSPGTTNVLNTGGGYLQSGFSFPTETGASADGGRQGSTYYLLDGVPNVDAYLGLAAPFPNADATAEFRVISNNFDARYGFSPGAVVSIETKSGTNKFHGGVFEFLRNNDLDASNWFTGQTDTLKRSQFGGYLGGPILHNRLFFFANYQGTRSVANGASNSTYTPTAAMLNGDFSAVPLHIRNPASGMPCDSTNGGPGCFAGNIIPVALLNPAALTLANTGLPVGQVASTGQVNYTTGKIINNFNEFTGRIDWDINQNQRLSVRSFTDYFTQPSGDVNGNILSVLQLNPYADIFNSPMEYYNNIVQHTWTISPSLLNSFTGFWTQMSSHSSAATNDASGQPLCLSKLINVSEPGCYIEGLSVTNGFSTGYTEPSSELRTTYGLADNVTKSLGNHTLSFGVNAWHQFSEQVTQYPAQPIVSFYGSFTNFGLADFLLGDAGGFTQGAGLVQGVHGYQLGLYGQDQYRLRPNLTLTAGLRWDPNLAPAVVGGLGSAFIPGQQSTMFPNAPVGVNFPGDHGVTNSLMPKTYGYFEPRIGVAWKPRSLPNTAVRAGFGLFDAPLPYSAYGHVSEVEPFSPTYTFYAGSTPIPFSDPWSAFAGTGGKSPFPPFFSLTNKPASDSTFTTPLTIPTVFSNNYHLGVTESWNVSVEQQFYSNFALHMAYVGSESYHQTEAIDQNPGFYNADPTLNGQRLRYPNFGQILTDFSNGTATYHALQVGLEKRLSHNLQFQSNFTWSKSIDLAASGNIAFGSPELPDPFSLSFNRGISYLNVPLISITNFVYSTPALTTHRLLTREVLGGWEASGIITAQSGSPFTIAGASGNNSGALQYGDRADRVPNQPIAEHEGSREQWLNHYFNTAAFADNAPGTFGNSGKNELTGPSVVTADLGASKNWAIRDAWDLQFRLEAFNALNHPSFGTPNNNVGSGPDSFGHITSIGAVQPRIVQGALKLTF
jgi:outer membrane receptor protein involved in Fe transport